MHERPELRAEPCVHYVRRLPCPNLDRDAPESQLLLDEFVRKLGVNSAPGFSIAVLASSTSLSVGKTQQVSAQTWQRARSQPSRIDRLHDAGI